MERRAPAVKNKAPAPIQITAEQLLREARERQAPSGAPPPRQRLVDYEEVSEYAGRKRTELENAVRRNPRSSASWIRYANFEVTLKEFARARSVYERGLDVDSSAINLWLSYVEMELKHKNINHARNILDRAVTILPRVSQFWLKYTYIEEMVGNITGARTIFERWMQWEPEPAAWLAYAKMEMRYKEFERAKLVYERFVDCHPEDPKNWLKLTNFLEEQGDYDAVRSTYMKAVEYFDPSAANDVATA